MNEADYEKKIQALKHAECLNEAWLEYTEAFKKIEPWRKLVVREEIAQRIWGVIYLLQAIGNPEFEGTENHQKTIDDAESWDSMEGDE